MQRVDSESMAALYATTHPGWATGTARQFHFGVEQIALRGGDVIRPQASGVTVIVGSNNAGKSTILRELHQWIGHHPSQPRPPMMSVDSVSLNVQGNDADMIAWIGLGTPFVTSGTSMGFARNGGLHDPTTLAYLWSQAQNGVADLASFFTFYGNAAGRFSVGGSAEMREAGDDPAIHPIHTLQDSRELRDRINATSQSVFGKPLTLDTLGRTVRLRVGEVDSPAPPH